MEGLFYQFAAKVNPKEIGYDPFIKTPEALDGSFTGVLNLIYFASGMVAVLVIVIAGYLFTTSNGDAGRIKKARFMIVGAVVGIIVVMSAFIITQYVMRSIL